jgi:hypothetical protein
MAIDREEIQKKAQQSIDSLKKENHILMSAVYILLKKFSLKKRHWIFAELDVIDSAKKIAGIVDTEKNEN